MLNKRQGIFQNAIDVSLRVQDGASERLQDQIVEEVKELENTKTEEALQLAEKERDLWMYQNEKEEAKRLQGVRKPRKDEELAWAPPKKNSDWPGWEGATKTEESEWRLEPEGGAEVPGIIIVSDAVEGTIVDLAEAKLSRRGSERLNEGEDIESPKKIVIRVKLASVVVSGGDEAYTTNQCQNFFNKHLQTKGEKPLTKRAVERGGGKEGVSWRSVEKGGERNIFAWDVGITSPRKKQSKEVSRTG